MKKFTGVKLAVGSLVIAGALTAGAFPVTAMAFNPQPDPPGRVVPTEALNPQPLTPMPAVTHALNPQPLPPGRA
jgi:hypothetical protein